MKERGVSLRMYLIVRTMVETDCSVPVATEAVASTAIEHPEWDMEQRRTWDEWTAEYDSQAQA